MISPHTPPGTKVVCIQLPRETISRYTKRPRPLDRKMALGATYTVVRIVPADWQPTGYVAELQEIGPRSLYGLHLFRRLDLPECLTNLLDVQPTDLEVVE
jgi:hypothetical protein